MAACVDHARIAVADAERLGVDSLLSQALAIRVLVSFMYGAGLDEPSLKRALALEDPDTAAAATFRASAVAAVISGWSGQLDSAREQMSEVQQRLLQSGTEIDIVWAANEAAMMDICRGRYHDAAATIDDAMQRAEQMAGQEPAHSPVGVSVENHSLYR